MGLRLLLLCLFLGVGAIATIGTLTGSIENELSSRGQEILGGDIEVHVWQRRLTEEESAALADLGTLEVGTRMQAIAMRGNLSAPVALKAVGPNWPLYGRLVLQDGRTVGAPAESTAWVAEGAAERLDAKVGDSFTIGNKRLKVGGIIADEPDRISEGFTLGTAVIVPRALPESAGLTAPGSMFRSKVRVALKQERNPATVVAELEQRFGEAGLGYRTRDNASPGTERFVANMGEFLVLVGLAALVIAGIGIGGGVTSYLEARRTSIATLKVLGATTGDIARIYLLQITAAALIGSLAGLTAGVLITPLLANALGALLPVSTDFAIDAGALLTASAYGLLVALIFAAPPLVRSRTYPAIALMRVRVSPLALPRKELALPVGIGLAAIVTLALVSANQPRITALFLLGAAAVLAFLGVLGVAIRKAAQAAPRPRDPLLRAGLSNLHRPASQTGALVTALGFGLSAFVLLAAIQTSLEANILARVPQRAPDYFVLDVPRDKAPEFRSAVLETVPDADVRTVPALRGKILAYGPQEAMVRVADLAEMPENAWFLRGERGLTYSREIPKGSALTKGEWWPPGHSGEPLVSIDEDLASTVGLKIGDMLTISLLGVERSARISSFRRIEWGSMGFNYVLVFSPNALADAPHNLAATIDVPAGAAKDGLLRRLVRAFPSTSVIETGGLLRDARALLTQMSAAILATASVAVLAGLAVLMGAIAAARASRLYDNVILRVLGASRRQLLLLQLAEYGLLASILAVVALALGSGIGWAVITQMFEFDWLPHWPTILGVLGAGLVLVIGFALVGSLPLLRAKPARALREL